MDSFKFEDLRERTITIPGKGDFVMKELTGEKREKYAVYMDFISKYEKKKAETEDLEEALKLAGMIAKIKKDAVKLSAPIPDEVLEETISSYREFEFMALMKELNRVDDVVKKARSLVQEV